MTPMLTTILRQQDEYFFARNEQLFTTLNWIRERREELAQYGVEARELGRLPEPLVALLREGSLFDLALPSEVGGLGLTSAAQTRVIEELSAIDASIGWCVMIGIDSAIYRGYLEESVRAAVYPTPNLISAGWIHPQGEAVNLGDGTCRVTGRWRFGSGVNHADVVLGGVRYFPDADSDAWEWRVVVFDKPTLEIEDSWHTWGLQGSGSQHYSAHELIIPLDRTFSFDNPVLIEPLQRPFDAVLRKMSGVPLGTAVGAVVSVVDALSSRNPELASSDDKPNDRTMNSVGELTAELVSIRAAVYSSLDAAWQIYINPDYDADEAEAAVVATAAVRQRAFQSARNIVIGAGDLLGGQSVYRAAGDIGARVSDLNVTAQHAVGQTALLDLVGNRLLGNAAAGPFF